VPYFNIIRNKRGVKACNIFGLWMSIKDLKNNLIIAKAENNKEDIKLFKTGLECYKQNKDLFAEQEN
jgi:hypothetical protein